MDVEQCRKYGVLWTKQGIEEMLLCIESIVFAVCGWRGREYICFCLSMHKISLEE